jgi:5-methylcytosine-specific restriction endonuclease McrA
MRRIGKKTRLWLKERKLLIKNALSEKRIFLQNGIIFGSCEDCREIKKLEMDHIKKRSQGGGNEKENIAWVCRECHDRRDNQGDPLKKKRLSYL